MAGLKNPRPADSIRLRTIADERRLVDVAAKNRVGAEPRNELFVIDIPHRPAAGPGGWRVERWRMVDPDPAQPLPARRSLLELSMETDRRRQGTRMTTRWSDSDRREGRTAALGLGRLPYGDIGGSSKSIDQVTLDSAPREFDGLIALVIITIFRA